MAAQSHFMFLFVVLLQQSMLVFSLHRRCCNTFTISCHSWFHSNLISICSYPLKYFPKRHHLSSYVPFCFRLPLPWLMYTMIFNKVYRVDSTGMLCSIVLLFAILIFVIITIILFKWRMHRPMGYVMFLLYAVFVTISLLLQFEIIRCPNIIG